ncbi:hypothetical protein [Paraburkholderia sp. GAS334]|uniref:hypothetical protein n=1 Tax=Paraburkholderia sp. GAS334 TaxID=3035131 RepID=UPI003D194A84
MTVAIWTSPALRVKKVPIDRTKSAALRSGLFATALFAARACWPSRATSRRDVLRWCDANVNSWQQRLREALKVAEQVRWREPNLAGGMSQQTDRSERGYVAALH